MTIKAWSVSCTAYYVGSIDFAVDDSEVSSSEQAAQFAEQLVRGHNIPVDLGFSSWKSFDNGELQDVAEADVQENYVEHAVKFKPWDSSPQPLPLWGESLVRLEPVVLQPGGQSVKIVNSWSPDWDKLADIDVLPDDPEIAPDTNRDRQLQRVVERVLVLSTAHMPSDAPDFGDIWFNEHESGYIVFVVDHRDAEAGWPEWFYPILGLANEQECSLINFDQDAEVLDSLKTYDW